MPRDLKIGMTFGLVVALCAVVWFSARPELTASLGFFHADRPAYRFPEGQPSLTDGSQTESASTTEPPEANVPDLTVYEQPEKIKTERFHIVRKGETLSDISSQYYGSAKNWRKIAEANRSVVKDAHIVKPGAKLMIPD